MIAMLNTLMLLCRIRIYEPRYVDEWGHRVPYVATCQAIP